MPRWFLHPTFPFETFPRMSVPVFSIHARGGSVARPWTGLLVVLALSLFGVAEARPPVAAVDARVELQVGDVALSRYLVEKNLARFREEFARRTKREPQAEDLSRWLEGFVTQQGLIALALRDGYGARPEVGAVVERMERHMLTNPDGPFYAWLLDDSEDRDALVVRMLPIDLRPRTLAWARFPDAALARELLGADFGALDAPRLVERLAGLDRARSPHVRVFRGELGWPWEPLPELAAELAGTPAGRATGLLPVAHGVVVAVVLEVAEPAPGVVPRTPDSGMIRRTQLRALRNRRLHRVVGEHGLAANQPALAAVWTRLARAEWRSGLVPDGTLDDSADLTLVDFSPAHPSVRGALLPATAAAWQRYFNRLLVRRLPQDVEDLRESVEAMVLEELDLRDARDAGVDATAKFCADRENFRRAQALELFRRERWPVRGTGDAPAQTERVAAPTPGEARELAAGWTALDEFGATAAAREFLSRWQSLLISAAASPVADGSARFGSLSPHPAEVRNPKRIP